MALRRVARVGLPARLRANFGTRLGTVPTSTAGSVPGDTLPPASPCALPPRCRSGGRAWEPARSRAGNANRAEGCGREHRARWESTADARDPWTPGEAKDLFA